MDSEYEVHYSKMGDYMKRKNNDMQYVSKRLDSICDVIKSVAQGDYSVNCTVTARNDDFDTLAMGINMMIDEIRNSKNELKQSEDTYRVLVETIPDIVYRVNTKGFFTFISASIKSIGYEPDELIGKHFKELIHPDDVEAVSRANVLSEYKGKKTGDKKSPKLFDERRTGRRATKDLEMRLIPNTQEGENQYTNKRIFSLSVNVEVASSGIWSDLGKPHKKFLGTVGVIREITERKKAEDMLRKSQKNLAEAQKIAHLGSWEWDIVTNYLECSDEVYRIFEITPEQFGATYEAFLNSVHPDDRVKVQKAVDEALYKKKPYSINHRIILPDKSEHIVHEQAHVFYDKTGEPICMVGTVQDITEQKQAEEESRKLENRLRQAQKLEAIGQIASGVAHDFNNILGGITGYSDLIKIRLKNSPEIAKYAEKIIMIATKAGELTKQLLTFARKAPMDIKPVDAHDSIKNIIEMLQHTVDRRIEVQSLLSAKSSVIQADPSQIQNALLNLGINARDAMPNGGTLTFETEEVYLNLESFPDEHIRPAPGNYLRISIIDTGIGMDEEIKRRLFEPFFTTKERGKGTGLGLASIYGLIEQHNGYITIESEKGEGSTFNLYLPLVKKKESLKKDKNIKLSSGKGSILIVDDEEIIRDSTSEILEDLGYLVSCCTNGEEAVEHYTKNHESIDVVILDINMPKLSGLECFRRLKQVNPNVVVIIATGYGSAKERTKIKDEGAKIFIEKPFRVQKLSDTLKTALQKGQ